LLKRVKDQLISPWQSFQDRLRIAFHFDLSFGLYVPTRTHNGRAQLGQRVRELRKIQGKTLQELGKTAGLSKSLAEALSIDVSALFAENAPQPPIQSSGRRSVARKGTGEIYETDRYRYEILCAELSPKEIFPFVATLLAHSISSARDLIRHSGEEFLFVLEGRVEVHCEFYSPTILEPGDGIYIDSTMGHAMLSGGDKDAKILWVVTNPSNVPQARPGKPIRDPRKNPKRPIR
jgi:mannose-6-phosphate isomerase-like protein (cupin superfamily)